MFANDNAIETIKLGTKWTLPLNSKCSFYDSLYVYDGSNYVPYKGSLPPNEITQFYTRKGIPKQASVIASEPTAPVIDKAAVTDNVITESVSDAPEQINGTVDESPCDNISNTDVAKEIESGAVNKLDVDQTGQKANKLASNSVSGNIVKLPLNTCDEQSLMQAA